MEKFLRNINKDQKLIKKNRGVKKVMKKNKDIKKVENINEDIKKVEDINEDQKLIKKNIETRVINIRIRINKVKIEKLLSEVIELEKEHLKNREELIKIYGNEYREKFNKIEKLINNIKGKYETKKKNRKLNLKNYDNKMIKRLKIMESEDNENFEALVCIEKYIIDKYTKFITENEEVKRKRDKIKCESSKKCITAYYGLKDNLCCDSHRDFLSRRKYKT